MIALLLLSLLIIDVSSFQFGSTSRSYIIRDRLNMRAENFDALLFDCDGVIAETERDVHRISFNRAFKEKGLADVWDEDLYGELLKTGGGKERMTKYFDQQGWPSSVKEDERKEFVANLHKMKTGFFNEVVESGAVELRPGVMRLIDEAFANGVEVAVCSTSNVNAVTTIIKTLLGERYNKMQIFAGDMVANKKPAPDVYLLASQTLGISPDRCWVVEDSGIGLASAKAAGMKCVVTMSIYTRDEDFSNADIVTEDLDKGSVDGPISVALMNFKNRPISSNKGSGNANADLFGAEPNYGDMFSKIADGKGTPFG